MRILLVGEGDGVLLLGWEFMLGMEAEVALLVEDGDGVLLVVGDVEVLNMTSEAIVLVGEGDDEMDIGIICGLNTDSTVGEGSAEKLARAVVGTAIILAGDGIDGDVDMDVDVDGSGLSESDRGAAEVSNAGENDLEVVIVVTGESDEEGDNEDEDGDRSKITKGTVELVGIVVVPLAKGNQAVVERVEVQPASGFGYDKRTPGKAQV
ncbi:hypothetical protein EKO27_g5312 [Xylaria grammica]|uniref:Uncharacterized protein n=1 Tax=Xylaria grammica TaxID=363999 RepID=A0A439D5Z3_9PEZI|nr:hypothetical protein EKO27_g5312 [Xylaria grammica]